MCSDWRQPGARWLRALATLAMAWLCAAAGLRTMFSPPTTTLEQMPSTTADRTSLARLPGYINVVMLAFAQPDAFYPGNLDLSGTGLEYRMPGPVLRDAVALLKRRNPATTVLLSVGGAAYAGWDRLALADIAALVRDLRLDGLDIDFEPRDPQCRPGPDDRIGCATDMAWEAILRRARVAAAAPAGADGVRLERRSLRRRAVPQGASAVRIHRHDVAGAAFGACRGPRPAVDQCLRRRAAVRSARIVPFLPCSAWPGRLALAWKWPGRAARGRSIEPGKPRRWHARSSGTGAAE